MEYLLHSTRSKSELIDDAVQWNAVSDEIEELKKIFYEFVQKWSGAGGSNSKENATRYYERHSKDPIIDDKFLNNAPLIEIEEELD